MFKILVVRLSSLGDVVLTTPVYQALRERYPEAQIVSLVKEQFAQVLAANPNVDGQILLRPGESLFQLIREVRGPRFDLLIDLHGNLRSRIVSFFSGASRCVRYSKATLARRLYVGWRLPSSELQRHTLDRYMETLSRLDGPGGRSPSPRLAAGGPRKILVIQTAFLGDAVLTTPMLSALRERFPEAAMTVLCTPEIAEVFRGHPGVADLIIYDKRRKDRGLARFWALVRSLGARGFDLAVIPHRSLTSALLARLAGIPRRVGFAASQGRWLLTDTVPFHWGVHDVDRNLALLSPLGIQEQRGRLYVRAAPPAAEKVAQRFLAEGVRPAQRLLGINAGSIWATKRWLPEGFAAVADRAIVELGAKAIFFGGAKDRPLIESIRARMKQTPIDWVGKTDLGELIAAILRCQVFLTNDSGPMHIAVAGNVPTVAIFGPTTKELGFFPYGPGHQVIEKDLACRPCGLHGAEKCPLGHFECMRTITVEEVFGAVAKAFAGQPVSVEGISE